MSAVAPTLDGVWSAEDTSPIEIEGALRRLLEERHRESEAYSPARVLNLVVVVDHSRRGEVIGRLEAVGRLHPSRTIVCSVAGDRDRLGAWATMACDVPERPGAIALCRERVDLEVGPRHLSRLDSVVRPLLVRDIGTLLWSPDHHADADDALAGLADSVLLDSSDAPELGAALARAAELGERLEVVDLAWLRAKPWRERIAATFDPPAWRTSLGQLASVSVRHHPGSAASGLLLLGWLAARLGWESSALEVSPEARGGSARSGSGDVELRLEPAPEQAAPGLAGVTLETHRGSRLSLDRAPGGLRAVRTGAKGRQSSWVVLGASRGEAGILGAGVREALLRQTLFEPALKHARTMVA